MSDLRYSLYCFFKDLIPIYPIYLLLFESKGLVAAEISLLLALWCIPLLILEIPTGILADNWHRKNLLVIAGLVKLLCYVCWFLADGFFLFALGFIFWGVSESLCSGSEEALLYDSLKENGQEYLFDRILGKGHFYSNLGVAIASITGGFLALVFGMRTVLVISIIMSSVSTVIASGFKEVNLYRKARAEDNLQKLKLKPYFETAEEAFTLCLSSKTLLVLILLTIIVIGTAGLLDEYDQLIAAGYGLNLGFVGVWICARYCIEALGGRLAYRFKNLLLLLKIGQGFPIIFTICVIAIICLSLAGINTNIYLMPFYGLFYFLMASARVLAEDAVQKQIETEGRSIIHSIVSLLYGMYGLLFFGAVSIITKTINIHKILLMTAGYIALVLMVFAINHRMIKSKTAV